MKILQVYKDYYPILGGIENTVRVLSKEISKREGFEMTVLTTNIGPKTERYNIDGVEVIKAGRQLKVASTPLSLQLIAEMRRQKPDIVHLHFPYPWGETAFLLSGHSKMVLTYHSDIVKQQGLLRLYEPLLSRVLERAQAIVATSPNYFASSPHLQRFASKCTTISCGIDPVRFECADEAKINEIRRRWPGPIILFVGVLRYYKGLPYLIRTMGSIDARLIIVGNGPLQSELQEVVSSEGVESKVIFVGAVSDEDLPSYYRAADVYVLPASQRSEALSISLMEAMASGLPVVSTELGTGTSYVNAGDETGLIVPPADPEALAKAINRLLDDDALRHRFGQAGMNRVRQLFTQDKMVNDMIALYERVYAV